VARPRLGAGGVRPWNAHARVPRLSRPNTAGRCSTARSFGVPRLLRAPGCCALPARELLSALRDRCRPRCSIARSRAIGATPPLAADSPACTRTRCRHYKMVLRCPPLPRGRGSARSRSCAGSRAPRAQCPVRGCRHGLRYVNWVEQRAPFAPPRKQRRSVRSRAGPARHVPLNPPRDEGEAPRAPPRPPRAASWRRVLGWRSPTRRSPWLKAYSASTCRRA
jgi:hypothetical protein